MSFIFKVTDKNKSKPVPVAAQLLSIFSIVYNYKYNHINSCHNFSSVLVNRVVDSIPKQTNHLPLMSYQQFITRLHFTIQFD